MLPHHLQCDQLMRDIIVETVSVSNHGVLSNHRATKFDYQHNSIGYFVTVMAKEFTGGWKIYD